MSQINITHNEHQFNYQVEYIRDNRVASAGFRYSYTDDPMLIQFESNDYTNIFPEHGQWTLNGRYTPVYTRFPAYTETCILRIYMPQFSVDTYDTTDYVFEAYTYINGKKIIIGSFLFNRTDCVANVYNNRIKNSEYMECIDFIVPDPWNVMYGDNWIDFRKYVCEEPEQINNTGSVLTCGLYPVTCGDNMYSLLNGYNGGTCGMNVGIENTDYLNLELSINDDIFAQAVFNKEYKGDLWTYMFETYDIRTSHIDFILFANTNHGPKNILSKTVVGNVVEGPIDSGVCWNGEELGFTTWNDWSEDLKLECVMTIYDINNAELMSVKSNMIPVTQDIFRFFLPMHGFKGINLTEITDMNEYKLNVVNKIDKKVIKIEHPSDAKANLLKPIFIRITDGPSLIFHPQINENVCIDLNNLKAATKIFYINIEGVEFCEIGRVPEGVVFNIIGNQLPNKIKEGEYQILNEEKTGITSGKYIYK